MGDHLYGQPVPILVEGISIYHDLEGRDKVSDISNHGWQETGEDGNGVVLIYLVCMRGHVCSYMCRCTYVHTNVEVRGQL